MVPPRSSDYVDRADASQGLRHRTRGLSSQQKVAGSNKDTCGYQLEVAYAGNYPSLPNKKIRICEGGGGYLN